MLYDQGQLVNVYLDAFVIWKDTMYASVSRDILDYLRRDMIDQDGGIYSAEDADSAEFEGVPRKKEGAFYVWTDQEVCLLTLLLLWFFALTIYGRQSACFSHRMLIAMFCMPVCLQDIGV
jgi:uncharacterized protein YyaL (SSP411 family)